MATLVAKAYHPVNGSTEEIWEGFSWECLFFGCFWFAAKSMWGWAVASAALAVVTAGFSWLLFPFFANGVYAKHLLAQGYLNEDQWRAKQAPPKQSPLAPRPASGSVADELMKLAKLRDQGLLSGDEFQREKARLLR